MLTNFDVVKANAFIGLDSPGQGNRYFVKPYSGGDGQSGKSPRTALKTLAAALAKCTANQNDVVYLLAESNTAASTTDLQETVLDWNKDLVHLIGVGNGSFLGQRARISNLSTATAIVNGLVIVSANGCVVKNIEIIQEAAATNPTGASIALVVSGQRNAFVNCQISGIASTELDDANSRSLKVTGSENYFKSCYIGLDTVIRGTAAAEVEVADSVARTIFEDCFFSTYTSADGFLMVKYSAPDRFILFKNCIMNAVQNITSATKPAAAISAATSVNGQIIWHGSAAYGFDDVAAAGDSKILVSTFAAHAADGGLGGSLTIS